MQRRTKIDVEMKTVPISIFVLYRSASAVTML